MALAENWKENPGRLEDDEIAALDAVFGGIEAAVGIRSAHQATVLKLAGVRGGSPIRDALQPVEYWACWSTRERRSPGLVAYRAFRAMTDEVEGARHVAVLFRAYGPRPPGPEFDTVVTLGMLGRLIVLTDAAEEIARVADAQSVAGAVARVVLGKPHPTANKLARKVYDREQAAVTRRLRDAADALLVAAVKAFRVARDRLLGGEYER